MHHTISNSNTQPAEAIGATPAQASPSCPDTQPTEIFSTVSSTASAQASPSTTTPAQTEPSSTTPAQATIANDWLTVTVSSRGAEPQSIIAGGIERLWCADPAIWGKHAPLLFPIIGRMRDGSYEIGGEPTPAPRHGFCREREFQLTNATPTSLTFATTNDDTTRACFPFKFRLEVEFALSGRTLTKTHRVTNTGIRTFPFELGGHEAYALHLAPNEGPNDWYVQFGEPSAEPQAQLVPSEREPQTTSAVAQPQTTSDAHQPNENLSPLSTEITQHDFPSSLECYGMDADGILVEPTFPLPLENGQLRKVPEQLGQDTFTLVNVPDNRATLASTVHSHSVTVEFPDFPYLGIWSAAGQRNTNGEIDPGYLCIEPWSALPDGHFMPREFARKSGARLVSPGKTVTLAYRMTFN